MLRSKKVEKKGRGEGRLGAGSLPPGVLGQDYIGESFLWKEACGRRCVSLRAREPVILTGAAHSPHTPAAHTSKMASNMVNHYDGEDLDDIGYLQSPNVKPDIGMSVPKMPAKLVPSGGQFSPGGEGLDSAKY